MRFSAATIATTLSGEGLSIAASSQSTLATASPATWTVNGITSATPTPEPTSAMLILLGEAGLALRRKQK